MEPFEALTTHLQEVFALGQHEDLQGWFRMLLRILAGATGRAHEYEEVNVEEAPGQQAAAKVHKTSRGNCGRSGPHGAEVIEFHTEYWNDGSWQSF